MSAFDRHIGHRRTFHPALSRSNFADPPGSRRCAERCRFSVLQPVPIGRDSIVNFLSLSFRPHVSLAYLFTVGVLTFALARILRDRHEISPRRLIPSLLATVAALALTDESSLALLIAGLGVLWLFDPGILGADRRRGALVLLALAGTIAVAALVFEGAIGACAPHYGLTIVAPRAPGFLNPPVSLGTWEGVRYFVHDLLVGAPRGARRARAGLAGRSQGQTNGSVLRRHPGVLDFGLRLPRAQSHAHRESPVGHGAVRAGAHRGGARARGIGPRISAGGRGRKLAGVGHLHRMRAGRRLHRRVAVERGRRA